MKILKNIINFILYTLITAVTGIAISIKELLFGHPLLRILVLLFYTAIILPVIFAKTGILLIIAGIYIIYCVVISILLMRQAPDTGDQSGIVNRYENLFSGMTEMEAKKKYRELMKEYHPDNTATGDAKKAIEIQKEYENYRNSR